MSINYTLHASLQQAFFDVVLALALLVAWRLVRWLPREIRWRRERARREADELAVFRKNAEERWARQHARRRRRRSQ